jgi:DNA polymerase-3 subunit epsilon
MTPTGAPAPSTRQTPHPDAATALLDRLAATVFIVIDFEALTPAGRPAVPTEVAAIALGVRDGQLAEEARFGELIRPPDDVPDTASDERITGITAQMLARARPAGQVLADLDRRIPATPRRLVAHHAPTEAGLVNRQRQHCPALAATALLDTVRLARAVIPHLPSYRLDEVLRHYRIPRPAGRHRAMPDAEVTSEIFRRLLADGARAGLWATLTDLDAAAGLQPRPAPGPHLTQEQLF